MERLSDLHRILTGAGADIDESGVVTGFGAPVAESRAARESAVVIPLTGAGLIRVAGPDAATFLNSQLTSDVAAVSPECAQYTGYCTPKGRLLATMLLFIHDDSFWLWLPAGLAADIAQRLQKFVLRAKVKIELASSELAMFAVTGPKAIARLTEVVGAPLARDFETRQVNGILLVTLPGNRYLISCPADQASPTWLKLSARMRAAGWNWWQLQSIRTGIATITSATQEAFIPQMLGLDTYGGVSFTKGCYPGQEIVARTRYLGDLKRNLYYGQCKQPLAAGDVILEAGADSAAGVVTDAAENFAHGWEFLAVLQRDAVNRKALLHTASGGVVTVLDRAGGAEKGER